MTNLSAVEKMAELMQQMEENSPRVAALQYCLKQVAEKVEEAEKRNAELESRCAALAAEAQGFKRFFMFAINAAFDGCDITGDQIQEVAKEIGLVRVESYSTEKHAEMSGDPSVMEEGDDFYIMNKTAATDDFLAEVRAQGVEMLNTQFKKCTGMLYADSVVSTAEHFAAQLRKGVQS
ncbi:TPA: hypothetical protein ND788_004365 [Enterobacter hormaechei]|uniref:hypothetical protein n=1 Tax=Enterobacter hormaechei TaxID=158836 RepID=UPI000735D357|nr:hypothetical protein [Enterobacter hormaechei]KTJ57485.1 hypothetical protein ASU81_01690 [Enterobacter hormaechei subsp. steigerwaltii]MBW7609996.1 hypothetical protein [Enterobacter hormaechei]HAS9375195.1 hypothetical protein [Enterobacter hormaechei]HAV1684640.1 hypothetical protein [Enterobacter hormaechei subsp. steigerwaltii]HCD6307580.1 hypothetical protein [Enterobacter hormaechei]